ncbi:MAG: Ig-like domain-containing protein [Mariprofundales bacterium]
MLRLLYMPRRVYVVFITALFIVGIISLSGCSAPETGAQVVPISNTPLIANFDPKGKILPFPNNLLFSGSTDGTLNIPVAITLPAPETYTDPQMAMNKLDGFSTTSPIITTFSKAVDAASITPTTVRLFEVTTTIQGAVTGVVAELAFGTEFVALLSPKDATQRTLVISPMPTMPLKGGTQYMVVLTDGISSLAGSPASASMTFSLTKGTNPLLDATAKSTSPLLKDAEALGLEPLRQLTQTMLFAANGAGIAPANVVLAWTFKTQSIGKVLQAIQQEPYTFTAADMISVPIPPSLATNGLGTLDTYTFALANNLIDAYSLKAFNAIASVVIGAINIPYYLDAYSNTNPTGPIRGFFQTDQYGMPQVKSVQTIPFVLTIPNKAPVLGSWPVVIFQHGFSVDKSVVVGLANSLATAGFATIAIDAVLHGNRTFGMDLLTQVQDAYGAWQTIANAPDGVADSSGSHYLNLSSLLTSRDNIRQSVADLIHLTRILEVQMVDVVNNSTGAPSLGGDGVPDLLQTGFSFVGHSNGGILGSLFMAVEPSVKAAVLANPGAGYSNIVQNSAEISPLILGGLAAKGVVQGSAAFDQYFMAVNMILDDADPINYGIVHNNWMNTNGQNILLMKTTPDAVVPNSTTDIMAAVFGLAPVSTTTAGSGMVNYISGTHSTFLTPQSRTNPLAFLAAYTEMQTATANFIGSAALGAPMIVVTDTTVVK